MTPPVLRSTLIRETPTAWWYECLLRDGRTITMAIPKGVE